MDKIRVVVDTNIFINGIFKGEQFAKALFQLKSCNKVTFVMNREMQDELLVTFSNILMAAFERSGKKQESIKIIPLCASLSKCLWQVEEVDHIIHTEYCVNDKSDNKFIDCCIDSDVKYLITQDEHINSVSKELSSEYGIEVLSPFQFYTKYKSKKL